MTESDNHRSTFAAFTGRFEAAHWPSLLVRRNGGSAQRAARTIGGQRTTAASSLLTPKMAAADLGISTKTLTGHADDGELRYINVGRGKKKKRRMYTRADLEEFKERRAQREVRCLSTGTKRARSTTSISNSKATAFTDLRDARTREKQKHSNLPSATARNGKPR
jgi:hypothetical protein